MAATKLDEFGRPIDNPFFGGGGLGNALASLPGTPILGGGASAGSSLPPPGTATGGTGLGPGGMPNVTNSPNPGRYAPPGGTDLPDDPYRINEGPGYTSGYQTPGAQGPLAGSTPQTNPGLPPPASTAGTGNFWGDQNPWAQNVGASINDQPVSFASPGNPNPNYITPEAASKIGQTFGANVVSQNLNNMSSPGSSAPSAPIYGLDFGRGDIQGADVAATGLARGDTPQQIAERYAAGLNTKAWAGDNPIPTTARSDADGMWNYSTPVSTYDPSQSNAQQAQLIQWLKGQIGQA